MTSGSADEKLVTSFGLHFFILIYSSVIFGAKMFNILNNNVQYIEQRINNVSA